MVAFGECGFAAEIPAFAGMEGGGRRFSFSELAEETEALSYNLHFFCFAIS